MISSNRRCRHVNGHNPRNCRNDKAGTDFSISLSGCKDVCSAHASCVGFVHFSHSSVPNGYCYPIPSDTSCPTGFYMHGTGPLTASMNDLKADLKAANPHYACYGKKLGKVFQSLHFVLKFPYRNNTGSMLLNFNLIHDR